MGSVTIRDVAREAEVSITTVSQILRENSRYQFHPNTVERVREAAERLGYQAHAAARLLRQQETKMIGLAVRLTVHPHLNRLLVAVHDELMQRGYDAVLCEPNQLIPTHSHAPFPSPEMLAGILSLDLSLEQAVPDFYEMLQRKLPLIALYPVASPEVQTVCTDMAHGIELAVEHLVNLGHRSIAFTSFVKTEFPSDYIKVDGWTRAIKKYKLARGCAHIVPVHHTNTLIELGPIIAQHLKTLQPRPTALVTVSDEVALSAMGAIQAMGWRVPEDISITGYDGIDFGLYCNPSLTTVAQPVREVAHSAVDRMLRLVRKTNVEAYDGPMKQWIAPTLVVRRSTAPPTT